MYKKFVEICHQVGWKCTAQRLAIYNFLDENHMHPNVDAVWQGVKLTLPTITRESVYRILNEFTAKGIASRLDHIDSARYDSRTLPHGHFICEKCGGITDFDLTDGTGLPEVKVAGKINHPEFRAVGVCEQCLKEIDEK